ncbi:CRB_1a_G0031430.mRNA.1.CDS.1 [Saccharomyces cerevisiae]|nr:CRB_1a_G0031430.mRNA.1.CDS.1 [Saccharomyces cerevisiae]CAI7373680.1 CRB_1a_G0031430.mRNA.1.CDS.1 [Saccharomyces cerevisiae]
MKIFSTLLSQKPKGKLVIRPSTTIHSSDPFSKFIVTKNTEPLSLGDLRKSDSGNSAVCLNAENTILSTLADLQKEEERNWDPVKFVAGKLRGVISPIQAYVTIGKKFSPNSLVYTSRFFQLHYFPEDHFMSCFRKSKPAITVKSNKKFYLNGKVFNKDKEYFNETRISKANEVELSKIQTAMTRLTNRHRNSIPSEFAYLRRDLKLKVKTTFIKEWCKLNGDKAIREYVNLNGSPNINPASMKGKPKKSFLDNLGRSTVGTAKDGYYLYIVSIFPDKDMLGEFNDEVNRSVQKVANLDWDGFLTPKKGAKGKNWVESFNDSINVQTINKILEINKFPFELRREQTEG